MKRIELYKKNDSTIKKTFPCEDQATKDNLLASGEWVYNPKDCTDKKPEVVTPFEDIAEEKPKESFFKKKEKLDITKKKTKVLQEVDYDIH